MLCVVSLAKQSIGWQRDMSDRFDSRAGVSFDESHSAAHAMIG